MRLSFRHIVIGLFIAMMFASCKDDIVFNDSGESKLVAFITADPENGVQVTVKRSDLITQDTLSLPVQSATVRLFNKGNLLEARLTDSEGEVKFTYTPFSGDSLRVEVDNGSEVGLSGLAIMPRVPDITEFRTTYQTNTAQGVLLTFLDSVTTKDFYMLSMVGHRYVYKYDNWGKVVDSTEVAEPMAMKSVNRLFFSENNIVNNRQNFELFDDRIINGENFELFLDLDRFQLEEQLGKTAVHRLEVTIKLITEDYYRFLTTLSLNRPIYGGPFSIASQVPSNIEGGYGVFAAFTVDREEIKLE